jgi:hypothetical protein
MAENKIIKPPQLIKIKNGDPCFNRREFEDYIKALPKSEIKWEPLADRMRACENVSYRTKAVKKKNK